VLVKRLGLDFEHPAGFLKRHLKIDEYKGRAKAHCAKRFKNRYSEG